MAVGNTKISDLLFAVLLAAALGAAAAHEPSSQDVNTACAHVTEPKLCEDVIAKAKPSTVHELTLASLDEAMAKAEEASTVADKVIKQTSSSKVKTDLGDCSDVYEQARVQLKKAIANIKNSGNYISVISEIESAHTLVDRCNDVFNSQPGEDDPVVQATDLLKSLVGNSLSLAVMIKKDPNADGSAPTYTASGNEAAPTAGGPAGADPVPKAGSTTSRRLKSIIN